MDIDFSELKLPVGRPEEGTQEERIDLKEYLREASFQRRWSAFFLFWEGVIISKATKINKPKYISYMEEFYGEVLGKFSELPIGKQKTVLADQFPINKLYELTNLSEPLLFEDPKDNQDFVEVLKTDTL